ncbi:MAG: hypothetical protein ABJ084_03375 [Halioglobus sp.]
MFRLVWQFKCLMVCVLAGFTGSALAQEWEPVTDAEELKQLMSDTVMVSTLEPGVEAKAVYNADGTGTLNAWGDTFSRTWEVRDSSACVNSRGVDTCYAIERDTQEESMYRVTNLTTQESAIVSITRDGEPIIVAGSGVGMGKPSADEIAKSLANPNTPLASLTLKTQYRAFKGDLPNASDQNSTTLLFQPSFPFSLDNGATVFFRPALPVLLDQPVFEGDELDFDSVSGLGDIGFDLAYGRTTDTGILWAVGMISTLPTATKDELGPDRWSAGPEFILGKLSKKYVVGALTSYQTDIAGSGDADVSLTTINAFFTLLPGGGWNWGSAPIINYDHDDSQWTLPVNLSVGKTVLFGGRPWKMSAEINYYTEQADAFGPEWMFGINVAPVVENVFAKYF